MMDMTGSSMGSMQSMGGMDPMSMGAGMNMSTYGTINGTGTIYQSMVGYGTTNAMGVYGSDGIGPAGFLTALFSLAFKVFVILLVIGLIAGLKSKKLHL